MKSKRMSVAGVRIRPDGTTIRMIHDRDEDLYYVGIEMSINPNGKSTTEPYGCRTFPHLEDAQSEMESLSW